MAVGADVTLGSPACCSQLSIVLDILRGLTHPCVSSTWQHGQSTSQALAAPIGAQNHVPVMTCACSQQVAAPALTAPSLHRELWQGSWLAVLRWTPLQELAQERAAVAQGGWQSDKYEADIKDCALFQAFLAAGRALKVAAAVSVSVYVEVTQLSAANEASKARNTSTLKRTGTNIRPKRGMFTCQGLACCCNLLTSLCDPRQLMLHRKSSIKVSLRLDVAVWLLTSPRGS